MGLEHARTATTPSVSATQEHLESGPRPENTVIRSRSKGIAKETEQIFADIDHHARHLQDDGQRYPEGDQTLNGQPCKAYVLKGSDRSDLGLKSDEARRAYRQFFYLDQQSRLVRVVTEERRRRPLECHAV